jgi:hypothetical protein
MKSFGNLNGDLEPIIVEEDTEGGVESLMAPMFSVVEAHTPSFKWIILQNRLENDTVTLLLVDWLHTVL